MAIADTLLQVKERIGKSAIKAGRKPDEIKLVAVSKTIEVQRVIEAIQAGAVIFGENRVQEAQKKISELKTYISHSNEGLKTAGCEWHLIGNLQKNKARTAVHVFDVVQSVDSKSLADEIDRQAHKTNKKQRVLIQVKLADEAAKHGIMEKDLMALIDTIANLNYLRLEGLMTMPPYFDDPEKARPYFAGLREIAEKVQRKGVAINELSMGMSHDFEVAIEEGATLVRVGTAIFGERSARV